MRKENHGLVMAFARCVRGIVHYYNNAVELALFFLKFQKYFREENMLSYEETYLKGEMLCSKLLIFGMMTILEARTVARS